MSNLKLIPVIEIWGNSENIIFPKEGPYWKYAEEYEKANAACLAAWGYDPMQSYSKGSQFYELSNLSDTNLLLQIRNSIDGYDVEEICPFDGGYVLNMSGKDLLFPQCCGDLGDIQCWKDLANGQSLLFWQGHPQPTITIKDDIITFDLSVDDSENFVPTPSEPIFEISIIDLQKAVGQTMEELQIFANRIESLANANALEIKKISNLLVWGINR